MAVNNSDRNGRALEYAVVKELSNIPNATLTQRAINDNARDKPKFDAISQESPQLQQQFIAAAVKISNWISHQFVNQTITIDRLPDSSTSVTDITINTPTAKLELSLKHNHFALKHPRPYSIAQACGYMKNTQQDISHRNLMQTVDNNFRALANGVPNYNNCTQAIISSLYNNVYGACVTSINNWSAGDTNLAKNLFGFMVNNGFYKIIVHTGTNLSVTVQDYLSLASVSTVNASINPASKYLTLNFSNGWEIALRVHTAATKISKPSSQLSLKFDAQRVAGTINEIIL
jgi:hypothetical protein